MKNSISTTTTKGTMINLSTFFQLILSGHTCILSILDKKVNNDVVDMIDADIDI